MPFLIWRRRRRRRPGRTALKSTKSPPEISLAELAHIKGSLASLSSKRCLRRSAPACLPACLPGCEHNQPAVCHSRNEFQLKVKKRRKKKNLGMKEETLLILRQTRQCLRKEVKNERRQSRRSIRCCRRVIVCTGREEVVNTHTPHTQTRVHARCRRRRGKSCRNPTFQKQREQQWVQSVTAVELNQFHLCVCVFSLSGSQLVEPG